MGTRNNNHVRVLSMSFALLVTVMLAASEWGVSRAQENQNSNSMNMNGSMQNGSMQNSNRGRRGGRRNATRRNRNMNTSNTNMGGNMNSDMTGDDAGMQGANTNMGGNMNSDASGSMQEGNMNSNMQSNMNMQGNMNTGGTRRGGRGRNRNRRNTNMNSDMNMNSNMGGNMNMDAGMNSNMNSNMNMSGDTSGGMSGGSMGSGSMASGAAADVSGDQTDLSGTYTGTLNFPEMNVNGDSTLTITGNDFTLTTPSGTQAGRVFAVTTRGYTSVAMRFNDAMAGGTGASTTPMVVSARARRMGDRLMLSKVPGGREISFTPAGGSMGGSRARTRRNRRGSR